MKEFQKGSSLFIKNQEIQFLIIVSLFWFAQYVYIPYQTTYLSQQGTGQIFTGIVIGAYGITQLLMRLPVGLSADMAGKQKGFMMAGSLLAGIASLLRVIFSNGSGFLAGNLLSGLASAMWISFMVFYTGHFHQKDQQQATSRIILFNNLGMLMGFLCSTVCYRRIGMKGICFLSVLAGFLAFFLSAFLKEFETKKCTLKKSELISVCKNKRLLAFSILALIQQGIQMTTAMSFTNQILGELGASGELIGLSSIIYMVSAVGCAALVSSGQCSRRGAEFWIPFVFGITALYCVLIPNAQKVNQILFLQVLPGLSTGILFSYLNSEAMTEVPIQMKSTAMGFFQAVYAIGMTCFPIIVSKLSADFSIRTGYYALAGVALLGNCIAIIFYRRKYSENQCTGQTI